MPWPELRVWATAAALFAAMAVSAWLGRSQRLGAVLLALLSFVWLTVDRLWEGPILLRVTSHNGLVTSDLIGLAGLVLAGWLGVRTRRTAPNLAGREEPRESPSPHG